MKAFTKDAVLIRGCAEEAIASRFVVRIERWSYQAVSSGFGMIPAAMAAP